MSTRGPQSWETASRSQCSLLNAVLSVLLRQLPLHLVTIFFCLMHCSNAFYGLAYGYLLTTITPFLEIDVLYIIIFILESTEF
jgi:hypothetical protein